jgi:predicted nucleotidyltransferase
LFGSQARGDARPDSDLLLFLNKPYKEEKDKDKTFEFVMKGWRYGAYLSIKIYTAKDWAMHPSIFRCNVERDGIEII